MKYWLGLFAIVAVTAAVVGLAFYRVQAPDRQRARFARIHPGMTRSEVIDLMGPADCEGAGPFGNGQVCGVLSWSPLDQRHYYSGFGVYLDEQETVVGKWEPLRKPGLP
jgi:hypothetical protein